MAVNVYVQTFGGPLFPTSANWDLRSLPRDTIYGAVLGRLVEMNGSGELAPGLLESWSPDSTFRRWTLRLRPDVAFHSGRHATARDLEFSFARYLLTPHECPEKSDRRIIVGAADVKPGADFASGAIAGLQVLDEHTLLVELERKNPAFPSLLVGGQDSLVPAEEINSDFLSWKRFPIGAGPYRVVDHEKDGSLLQLERWRPAAFPGSPLSLRIFSDLRHGQPDLIVGQPPADADFSKLRLVSPPVTAKIHGIYFNFRCALARDKRFRQALAMGIDFPAVVASTPGYVRNPDIVPTGFLSELTSPGRDVTEARRLLVAAGATSRQLLARVHTDDLSSPHLRWTHVLADQLRELGVNLQLEASGAFFEPKDSSTVFYLLGFIPDLTEMPMLYQLFRVGGVWVPVLDDADEHYERLVVEALAGNSSSERQRLTRKLAEHFRSNAYAIPIAEERLAYWVSPRISELGAQCQHTLDFSRIHVVQTC